MSQKELNEAVDRGIKKLIAFSTRNVEHCNGNVCRAELLAILEAMRQPEQSRVCGAIIQHTINGDVICLNTKPCNLHDIPQQPEQDSPKQPPPEKDPILEVYKRRSRLHINPPISHDF